jgi:hypothetical protein
MSKDILRVLLIILAFFLSLTAFAGGIGLLANLNAPPVEMLKGSPFIDYTIPGLALFVLVGGGGLAGAILLLRRHPLSIPAAGAAGIMIIFFEIVEVLVIGSEPGVARTLQIFYFSLGLVIVLLAAALWASRRNAVAKA